jgi:bisanhydrobacterioruberin hydratase
MNVPSDKLNRETISIFVLLILYSVGVWGFSRMDFGIINLTPANLMISLLILILNMRMSRKEIIQVVLPVYLIGYGIEAVGVKTGWPFGSYYYQEVFGFKFLETPLLIGVNWVILALGSQALVNRFMPSVHRLLKGVLAAVIMVLLDLIIEPVAITYQFWQWSGDIIPWSNYIAWFFVSLTIQAILAFGLPENKNRIAAFIFVIQVVFFGVVYLIR